MFIYHLLYLTEKMTHIFVSHDLSFFCLSFATSSQDSFILSTQTQVPSFTHSHLYGVVGSYYETWDRLCHFSQCFERKVFHWQQSAKSPYTLYQYLETHLLLSSSPQTLFKTLTMSSSHRIRVHLLSWGAEDSHCLVSKSIFVISSVTSLNLSWLICEAIF